MQAIAKVYSDLSVDVSPLLMLNGEVLERDSNLTFGRIMEGQRALLCVVPSRRSNETVVAEFLYPAGAAVSVPERCTHGLYLTRGNQVVGLNRVAGLANVTMPPPEGSYCCSVSTSDGTRKKSCINLQNCSSPCP